MDLQHELAMCELAGLELAGGLFYQESVANSTGQAQLSANLQAVGALKLTAAGYGVCLPTIQGIKFGDSDLGSFGASSCAYIAGAYGMAPMVSAGNGYGSWLGGAYAHQSLQTPAGASMAAKIQALAQTKHTGTGASGTAWAINAYGAPVLASSGNGQAMMAAARVFDAVQSAAGSSESYLPFGAYSATRYAVAGQGSTGYAGQCTIRSDMSAIGRTTPVLTAARVFDGTYALQGAALMLGKFCAYGDQRATINGLATSNYVPTHALRYVRLAKSYDFLIRAVELRGVTRPYETRKTTKPSDARSSQWSGA